MRTWQFYSTISRFLNRFEFLISELGMAESTSRWPNLPSGKSGNEHRTSGGFPRQLDERKKHGSNGPGQRINGLRPFSTIETDCMISAPEVFIQWIDGSGFVLRCTGTWTIA
jgi:hypothetical protein